MIPIQMDLGRLHTDMGSSREGKGMVWVCLDSGVLLLSWLLYNEIVIKFFTDNRKPT